MKRLTLKDVPAYVIPSSERLGWSQSAIVFVVRGMQRWPQLFAPR